MLPFEEVSTKMLAKCLKFLLQKKRREADIVDQEAVQVTRDLWAQFWALVNNSEKSLRERLTGTPFATQTIPFHNHIQNTLDLRVGRNSYEHCLYLACSGVHVR